MSPYTSKSFKLISGMALILQRFTFKAFRLIPIILSILQLTMLRSRNLNGYLTKPAVNPPHGVSMEINISRFELPARINFDLKLALSALKVTKANVHSQILTNIGI